MTTSERPPNPGIFLNLIERHRYPRKAEPCGRAAGLLCVGSQRSTACSLLLTWAVLFAVAPSAAQEPLLGSSTQLIAWNDDGSGSSEPLFSAGIGHSYNASITASRLRTLMQAAHLYADDNDNMFPPLASMLFDDAYWFSEGPPDPCAFYSPGDTDSAPTTIDNDVPDAENSAQISFTYLGNGLGTGDFNAVIFEENDDAHNGGLGRFVAYGSGYVQFVPSSPRPFKDISLTLDACRRGTITRWPGGTQDDYEFNLPPDTIMETSGKLRQLRMRHEGSISDSLLDVFDVEGWGTTHNSIQQSDAYRLLLPELTITGSGEGDVPVIFYHSFDSIVTLPLDNRDCSASVNLSVRWQDYQEVPELRSDLGGAIILGYGIIQYESISVLDASEVQPGDSGYLPGLTSYRLRGVAQLTIHVPAHVEAYVNWSASQLVRRAVHPGIAAGDFLRADTTFELAAALDDLDISGNSVDRIKMFLPTNYHWTNVSHSFPPDTVFPYHRGDWNLDGLVGPSDATRFAEAFTGPHNTSIENFDDLQTFDFDGDGDIDCDDYTLFEAAWTYFPGSLPDLPQCETTYTISVNVVGQGNVAVRPHTGPFHAGERAWIIADAGHDRRLVEWQGDLSGSDPVAMITVDGNINVTAVFEPACGLNFEASGACQGPASDPESSPLMSPTESIHGAIPNAESFSYPTTIELQGVRWYGAYSAFTGGDCSAQAQDDQFIVKIYDDDSGMPGNLLATYDDTTYLKRSATGELRAPQPLLEPLPEYRYELLFDTPFVAAAGQTYWVEVHNAHVLSGGDPCLWFWSSSDGGDGSSLFDAYNDGYGPEDVVDFDLTLCLMTFDQSNDDCNRNGLADDCETADGTSPDCNDNQIPDECESDIRPIFTQHPQSLDVDEGAPAAFSVAAEGAGLSYRWQKNGQYIPNAEQSTYTIAAAAPADAGVYRAEAVSPCGNTFSNTATLSVQEDYALVVNVVGDGCFVSLDPPGGHYAPGQQVTLTAYAPTGWRFDHWEGAASGTSTQIQIVMTDDKAVTAVFVQPTYALNISTVGQGDVDTLAFPAPVNGRYAYNTFVRLTPTPAAGWFFANWSGGGLSGSASPLTIVITADRDITATFSQEAAQTYRVTIMVVGQGQVVFDRPGGVYQPGQTATIEAVAADGWQFERWTGSIESTDTQVQLVMNTDYAMVAVFREATPGDDGNPETPGPGQTNDPPAELPSAVQDIIQQGMCGECANGAAAATLGTLLLWMPMRIGLRRRRKK